MSKLSVILCLATFCVAYSVAEDYYQMKINHEFKGLFDPKNDDQNENIENNNNKNNENIDYNNNNDNNYQRRDGRYGPSYESYEKQSYRKPSYEESYGQDHSSLTHAPTYRRSYEVPTYGYERPTYQQKSYSSPVSAIRNVEIRPIQTQGGYDQKDHVIEVKDDQPIVIHFRTHANQIKVEQTRIPEKAPEVKHEKSEDEPHRVIHEVYKPVIQEVREIIQPFRKVIQQVQPVLEEVQTVVHKAEPRYNNNGQLGGGGGGDYKPKRVASYNKRSSSGQNKKYNTLKDYLPQGSVTSVRGVPVYRSLYKGPAITEKNQ